MLPALASTLFQTMAAQQGGTGGGPLGSIGSMFSGGGGGEEPSSATSTATGTFSTGGITVTKSDPTLIIGLVIGGLLLALALRKGR